MGAEQMLAAHVRQEDTGSGRLRLVISSDREARGGTGFVTVAQVIDDPAGALAEIRRLRAEQVEWRTRAGHEAGRRSASLEPRESSGC